jgi:hypothetical protein
MDSLTLAKRGEGIPEHREGDPLRHLGGTPSAAPSIELSLRWGTIV